MIKKLLHFNLLALLALLLLPSDLFAVSQKEMEQARVIAAKAYLRYANDGSGYLDDINPVTMEELEAALKTKEKENIKAFKAIPVPNDYKDWNKEKLLEYWAVTAFQNKGLLEKGRGGRIRARSQINKMTIAAPQTEVKEKSASTPQAAAQQKDTLAENPVAQQLNELKEAEQKLFDQESLEEQDINLDKATNYTWVYIMVLAILVAIVVALVVYAANVMKKNGGISSAEPYNKDKDNLEDSEHYESMIADKDIEISMLKKKLENALKNNGDLKSQLEAVTSELASLKAVKSAGASHPQKPDSAPTKPTLRTIFLGRANARGIFVRADRSLNIGNSVFILDTTDGYSGTFRVADSPAAWSLALSNPKEYLETACTGYDLDDTSEASRIITESAGTAVFEGGCWRVIRKARIKYE